MTKKLSTTAKAKAACPPVKRLGGWVNEMRDAARAGFTGQDMVETMKGVGKMAKAGNMPAVEFVFGLVEYQFMQDEAERAAANPPASPGSADRDRKLIAYTLSANGRMTLPTLAKSLSLAVADVEDLCGDHEWFSLGGGWIDLKPGGRSAVG